MEPSNQRNDIKLAISLMALLTLQLFWQLYTVAITSENVVSFRETDLPLTTLYHQVQYLDEALTMTAKVAALNGNYRLYDRYKMFSEKLDSTLSSINRLAPETQQTMATEQVALANQKLIEMEEMAFDFLRSNEAESAQKLLFGNEYEKYKAVYAKGTEALGESIKLQTSISSKAIDNLIVYNLIMMAVFYIGALVLLIPYVKF